MENKTCSTCKNWAEDIYELDGTGICSKRAIYGGLTDYDFKCNKYKYDWILTVKNLLLKIFRRWYYKSIHSALR